MKNIDSKSLSRSHSRIPPFTKGEAVSGAKKQQGQIILISKKGCYLGIESRRKLDKVVFGSSFFHQQKWHEFELILSTQHQNLASRAKRDLVGSLSLKLKIMFYKSSSTFSSLRNQTLEPIRVLLQKRDHKTMLIAITGGGGSSCYDNHESFST